MKQELIDNFTQLGQQLSDECKANPEAHKRLTEDINKSIKIA